MISLESKVAVVTGAAHGIGRGTAELLASLGARVVLADIDGDRAERAAASIIGAGGTAIGHRANVEDEVEVQSMIQRAVDEFGGLDILDNNAALTDPAHFAKDLDIATMESAIWDRTFAVNVRGPMLGCKYAIPHMIERGGGSIINIASMMAAGGDVVNSAYGTSKAAVVGLTKYVASQHMNSGIRCNAVAPGLVVTQAAREQTPGKLIDIFETHQSRIGEPIDIARVVAFLASDWSSFVTGQVIAADGGMFSHVPVMPGRAAFVGYTAGPN
jgi:NAD(P)-dependent dehydrogenase (short-subunit alcohol dehydrogenase family)